MNKWIIKEGSKRFIEIPPPIELSLEAEIDILLAYKRAFKMGNVEISGIGHVKATKDAFYISDIIIPRQTCSREHTTWLGEEARRMDEDLERAGKDPSEYNFWWHSHVEGTAWFSSIDDGMIERHLHTLMDVEHLKYLASDFVGKDLPDETIAGPFISLVGNVFGDMSTRIDFLHRIGDKRRQYTFVEKPKRHMQSLPEQEKESIAWGRYPRIKELLDKNLRIRRK